MLLGLLQRLGLRRKRQGASGIWTAVAFAAFLLRQHQKRAGNGVVSLREELRPGESLLISHTTLPHS